MSGRVPREAEARVVSGVPCQERMFAGAGDGRRADGRGGQHTEDTLHPPPFSRKPEGNVEVEHGR